MPSLHRLPLLLLAGLLAGSPAAAQSADDWVSVRRGPCFGDCPIYQVTLRGDGTATYEGGDYAPRRGRYQGTVDPAQVHALLALLEEAGFWRMPRDRQLRVMDLPEMVLRAERGGRRHQVHTNLTPPELEQVEAAIDALVDSIEWLPPPREATRTAARTP